MKATSGGKGIRASEGGFSLVELLVVVLIIGILVAIATVSFVFAITRTKETACKSNRKVLEGALSEYLADNGLYPENLVDLFPEYIDDRGDFLCPLTHEPFEYTTNAARTSCMLTCSTCEE